MNFSRAAMSLRDRFEQHKRGAESRIAKMKHPAKTQDKQRQIALYADLIAVVNKHEGKSNA